MGAATLAGLVVTGGRAQADPPEYSFRTIVRPKNAKVTPDACGIFCNPVDCCSTGCCNGVYLFKCDDLCDGSYFYACIAPPCSGFCYSSQC